MSLYSEIGVGFTIMLIFPKYGKDKPLNSVDNAGVAFSSVLEIAV